MLESLGAAFHLVGGELLLVGERQLGVEGVGGEPVGGGGHTAREGGDGAEAPAHIGNRVSERNFIFDICIGLRI